MYTYVPPISLLPLIACLPACDLAPSCLSAYLPNNLPTYLPT